MLGTDILDEGDGIGATFQTNKAKWHKSCSVKYVGDKFKKVLNDLALSHTSAEIEQPEASSSEKRSTKSKAPMINLMEEECFLCGEPGSRKSSLHLCQTDGVYNNIKRCIEFLKDSKLLALLEGGDLLAKEAKYYTTCLTRLYNKCRRQSVITNQDNDRIMCKGVVFANMFYIQNRLNEYHNLFSKWHIYILNLKNLVEIICYFILVPFISICDTEDQDEDVLAFHYFAKRLRQTMTATSSTFSGTFTNGCEESSIPSILLATINSLCYGSPIRNNCRATQPVISICQMIMFNFKESTPKGNIVRNNTDCEPPLPLYVGLSTYGQNRDKATIDKLHDKGLSQANEKGAVCPSNLKNGIFTVSALDNIVYNPSSSTSRGSGFHGTGISLFQLPNKGECGVDQTFSIHYETVQKKGDRSVPSLPDFYSILTECVLSATKAETHLSEPELTDSMTPKGLDNNWYRNEEGWLETEPETSSPNVSWAAYYAERDTTHNPIAINVLLPLFHEKSTKLSMIKHGTTLVRNVGKSLNESQTPVICFDQPLFTICKIIQWPLEFGESQFVAMMGPLHIEQTFLRILGQFLEGNFVVRKTARPSSALGIDHAHEQNNAHLKGRGGAIGLTEDPSSLRRFTIAGPEVARLISEFEDLLQFFRYENQVCPPSLSPNGDIKPGNKADLARILEKLSNQTQIPSQTDAVIFDGAAVVHFLKPHENVKNIYEYCTQQLKPHILTIAQHLGAKRVDIVWDLYSKLSLKSSTRERRGLRGRQKDLPRKGLIPKKWEEYLKNPQNKEELFEYLAITLLEVIHEVQLVTNVKAVIQVNCEQTNPSNRSCKNMEEADGRIILHIQDMGNFGVS
ncbi:unnamed protein product [Ceutorhynchus assimilis]|uniref:Uncharacterized protein n=1 Tax=Ceutorhynchus assimilis TaxID=467358 RepID=A0A9N9MR06_9CUCU|nr:unnamed protein product [Ceutorhynchus assimilis]